MQHADILDQREPLRGAFYAALSLHLAILAAVAINAWIAAHSDTFGDKNAGGVAVGIQAVDTIPLPHHGPKNPVANDSQSEVPQAAPKHEKKVQVEKAPPDAIPLKSRKEKKRPVQAASEPNTFRPYKELDPNQLTSPKAPQVSNPIYTAMSGAGQVGLTNNTTLGTKCAEYASRIQQLVAQKWRTGDIDGRIQSGPLVIATFDLLRDGTVRNVALLQRSGIPSLDFSVQRAIADANPLPPIPPCFDRQSAKAEFTFELKR